MTQFQEIFGVDELSGPTVFFDGSCPLCRSEIGHYRRKDETGALCFVDVSEPNAAIPDGLTQQQAMERFHVQTGSGALVSGAAAFVEVWARLAGWRWAARAAALPGVLALLEFGYRLFLPARPMLAAAFGRLQRLKNLRARPDDPTTPNAERDIAMARPAIVSERPKTELTHEAS